MNNIIKENWEIIEQKLIKNMYEDGEFPLSLADEIKNVLERQIDSGWVKCSESLPEYTDDYNVTVGIGSILGYFEEVRTYRYEIFNGKNPYRKWIIPNNFNEIVNVIAWKNLPKPYQESEVL